MPRTRSSNTEATNIPDDKIMEDGGEATGKAELVVSQPLKLFILPKRAKSDARIVTLPHPRNGQPARYLACPETGLYEFKKVAAPKTVPRSWLITKPATPSSGDEESVETQGEEQDPAGSEDQSCKTPAQTHIARNADLFIATTIDPLFLVLPVLLGRTASKNADERKQLFLSSDDHLDEVAEASPHFQDILRWDHMRACLEARIATICDTVEAGDEQMYRVNERKALKALLQKAEGLSALGLPRSMDERFVTKPLDASTLLRKRQTRPAEGQSSPEKLESGDATPHTESSVPQSSAVSSTSQPSTGATSEAANVEATDSFVDTLQASPTIINLQRLKVAFDFICASYLPSPIADKLRRDFAEAEVSGIDSAPLTEYIAKVSNLRAEAARLNTLHDFSQKRGYDGEANEIREAKKRKMEEEKKRNATASRGVRDLKKVNTSGMKKLSAFFKAKEAKTS